MVWYKYDEFTMSKISCKYIYIWIHYRCDDTVVIIDQRKLWCLRQVQSWKISLCSSGPVEPLSLWFSLILSLQPASLCLSLELEQNLDPAGSCSHSHPLLSGCCLPCVGSVGLWTSTEWLVLCVDDLGLQEYGSRMLTEDETGTGAGQGPGQGPGQEQG